MSARETAELADLRAKCARQDILLIQAQKQALDSNNAAYISGKRESENAEELVHRVLFAEQHLARSTQ